MSEPARHLHVIDGDTGEKLDGCPMCAAKDDEIKGLTRHLRGEIRKVEELKRDKEAEARRSEWWPIAVEVHRCWRTLTAQVREEAGEKRSATARAKAAWNAERFYLIEPFLSKRDFGPEYCVRAVAGLAFDHFQTRRANGSRKRFDDWKYAFTETAQIEERAASAPRDWREQPAVRDALESIAQLQADRARQAKGQKAKAPRLIPETHSAPPDRRGAEH